MLDKTSATGFYCFTEVDCNLKNCNNFISYKKEYILKNQ